MRVLAALCVVALDAARGAPDAAQVARVQQQIAETRREILELYGADLDGLSEGVVFPGGPQGRKQLVERFLRAFALGDSFVIAVGGMSDVAGHGNYFEEAYPNVCGDALRPVFEAAGVRFQVRNMAMGGVPSFPNSVCMADNFGGDADVVVWDFRMVERDVHKGELFIRQALLMPRAPFVMYKRYQSYLRKDLKYAWEPAGLHVVDEMAAYNKLKKRSPALQNDRFCAKDPCPCPGQVRWHAGFKLQRFRGHHMALAYLDLFADAVATYGALLADGGAPGPDDPRWTIRRRPTLPEPFSKPLQAAFGSTAYRCAMTWQPRVGRGLLDLVDPQLGINGWELRHPSERTKKVTEQGQGACHYRDEKRSLVGNAKSHWVFFNVPGVRDGGSIAFCGDFASRKFQDYALIVVNQEEVMGELEPWLESKTLGVASACFSTSHNVVEGDNVVGFRVVSGDLSLALTHLVWT